MFCTNSKIEYFGNGVQTDFLYPYEYFEKSDIKVLTWDNDTFSYKLNYEGIEYSFVNASTIRFLEPPPFASDPLPGEPAIPNVVMVRLTDLSDSLALFSPGSSIRAQDLNDNFDQLRFGIEEIRCLTDQNSNLMELGWSKADSDSLYSTDVWITKLDDSHIPTVSSVENRIQDFEVHLLDSSVSSQDQNTGLWISDDLRFATSGAIAARHDVVLSDGGPIPNTHIQPGKLWIDTSNQRLSYWSQQGFWVNIASPVDTSNFVEEAPTDGKEYVRQDASWVEVTSPDEVDPFNALLNPTNSTFDPNSNFNFDITTVDVEFTGTSTTNIEYRWWQYEERQGETIDDIIPIYTSFDSIGTHKWNSNPTLGIAGRQSDYPGLGILKSRVICEVKVTFNDGTESIKFTDNTCGMNYAVSSEASINTALKQLLDRIEQLEQDHTQLMNDNNNGGGY